MNTEPIKAVTPIDGRYASKVSELSEVVSEFGLIKYRMLVELLWFLTLTDGKTVTGVVSRPLSNAQVKKVKQLIDLFNDDDALEIKDIEATTNHDVKAVELWIKQRLTDLGGFEELLEFVHFGRTSEDINNLAYAIMLSDVRDKVLLPAIDKIGKELEVKAQKYADVALLAQTHGQSATPTTLGKEMAVFVERLAKSRAQLINVKISAKLNGATGTFGAEVIAYPQIDWQSVSRKFIKTFGLEYTAVTTQIEPHDNQARLLNEMALINAILTDLSKDMWAYISRGVFKQKVIKGEVGSSTMPHKVNPIDFENAEGNLGLSNALCAYLANKLPISRLQRDLTDSTSQRAFGEVFGHALIGYKSLLKGLSKVEPDIAKIDAELANEWSILAEPLQTVMRKAGIADPYEKIKALSRGRTFTEKIYLDIVNSLDIPLKDKKLLLNLTPGSYVGLAPKIAKDIKYKT